jgi:hypothetical protein
MAEQLLLFANELRTRAKEILALAVSTDDLEIRNMRRVIAAGYEKLARRIEQRAREASQGVARGAALRAGRYFEPRRHPSICRYVWNQTRGSALRWARPRPRLPSFPADVREPGSTTRLGEWGRRYENPRHHRIRSSA